MAFTLRITFSGLCLFVPEPVAGGPTGKMHVLMPGMYGHHHHSDDRHVPVLSYDAGHLVTGGPLLGVTAVTSLTDQTLTLGGNTANLALCQTIVDLGEVTGRPVDPDHLGADGQRKLVSRVTLGAGGMTAVSPGVCWEWGPGEFRPIAHRVQWEIPDLEGDSLTLIADPLHDAGVGRELGTLYPVNGVISVNVFHETAQDLPPEPLPLEHQPVPMPGGTPPHFAAFYALFGAPVTIRLPKYWGKLDDCPEMEGPCAILPPDMGATPYTCLVAGAGGG
jgi:hypothetical protein